MPYQNARKKFREENGLTEVELNTILTTVQSSASTYLDDIFFDAVKKAYLDAARTFKNISNSKSGKSAALENFAREIQNYFLVAPSTETIFDSKHQDWCDKLMKDFKPFRITYGQAQKIVNMSFKYLYCRLKDVKNYEAYFKHCHIALDSFTLEWLWRNAQAQIKENNLGKYDAWSTLQYNGTKKARVTSPGYSEIVKVWRDLWKSTPPYTCTPFQAEFIFWPEIQLALATEAFLIQLENADIKRAKNIRVMSLGDKWKDIFNQLLLFNTKIWE